MSKKNYLGKDLEAMSFAQNYHKWIIDEFAPFLAGNVAEIGAGMGNFSEFLLATNMTHLVAFEPSKNMFASLENKYSKNGHITTVRSFFEEKSIDYIDAFDAVCYVNVLEHIEDDKEALSHAYKTLRKNGRLLIFVPALSFLYSNIDQTLGHYRRYSKSELIKTVSSAGFSIDKIKYFDIAGVIPWYITFVLLKKTFTECNVSLYDKIVVPIMRRIEQNIPPIIGKNLLLVGRKA